MSVQHAISLLKAIDTDPTLREQMYQFLHPHQVMEFLSLKGYGFNLNEFEDAVRILHLKCQSYEEADEFLHKAEWLRFQIKLSDTF